MSGETRHRPPRRATRLLERALRDDPAARAILGDLHEDFVRTVGERGAGSARRWYWMEALSLVFRRLVRRPTRKGSAGSAAVTQDLVSALRSLTRNPGFALLAAAVLGLGIGAGTAVFSILRPLVLAPLPFADPEALVWIENETDEPEPGLSALTQRSANLVDFRALARSFDGLTGFNAFFDHTGYTLTGDGEPERLVGVDVAHDLLDVLGVQPRLGRSFTHDEGEVGGPRAVILTHGLWQRRFGGDPEVVGRSVTLDDRPHTVVGVLPPDFDFASVFRPTARVDFLLPFPVIAAGDPGFQGNTLFLIGRLRPGITPAAAKSELDGILGRLAAQDPGRWGLGAELEPLRDHVAGPFRRGLLVLAAAAGTLLLIACVNVANLVLARAPARARELAVRRAMGASTRRIGRQLVFEALGIAAAAAALGAGLAWGIAGWVARDAGIRIPLLDRVHLDATALLVAVGLAALAGLVVGLVPLWAGHRGGQGSLLRSGGRGSSEGRSARRFRESLVVAEIALACTLLVVSGLLVRSFQAVLDVDLGFQAAGVVAWPIDAGEDFETPVERARFHADLADRVARLDGVEAVGLIDALPLGPNRSWTYHIVGGSTDERADNQAFPHLIDAGYLTAMEIPLVAGRRLTATDQTADAPPAVLLNESGARRIFGDADPLGQRLRFWGPWEWEIVGIVQDVRHLSPESAAGVQAYFPFGKIGDYHTLDLVVRSSLAIDRLVPAVRRAVAEADPTIPMREFSPVQSRVAEATSDRRFTLAVLTGFGATALLLAGLGIYGVLAQSVAERRRELGIRMALGATGGGLLGRVLGRSLLLGGIGIALGALLSLGVSRLLASLLYEVSATDPLAFGGAVVLMVAVATGAALLPAVRASRVRGSQVLSSE